MIPQKTIKELNKVLNERTWYRLLKVLWVVAYIILLVLFLSKGPTMKDFTDAILGFGVITISYLGATVALKRAVCYAVDYIVIGKVFLKEKWYSLLLIVLWGILSIYLMVALFLPATQR